MATVEILKGRFRGCLLGLACGDAVGTAVEFLPRGAFAPVSDMIGGGPFKLPAGAWTDDTSMALCLATSLVERGFDPRDQMERYVRWENEGYLSSTGSCFDIGNTVANALSHYQRTGNPYSGSVDPMSAGNGCIMRLAPVPMAYYRDQAAAVRFSGDSSRTTHAAPECVEACQLFGAMLFKALSGYSKDDILFGAHFPEGFQPKLSAKLAAIASGTYREKSESDIRGSGYVVDCLEAALWCFYGTDSYASAILKAVNLGQDTDTTAAVCGQLAGAYYGEAGIPEAWRRRVVDHDLIVTLAEQLMGSMK
jgi:ADP-ribosyl-[dinitrogen reductase] hydrolase